MGDPEDIPGTGDVTTTEPRLLQQSKVHQACGWKLQLELEEGTFDKWSILFYSQAVHMQC